MQNPGAQSYGGGAWPTSGRGRTGRRWPSGRRRPSGQSVERLPLLCTGGPALHQRQAPCIALPSPPLCRHTRGRAAHSHSGADLRCPSTPH
ncbi:hypothetical protein FHW73_001886 [Luteimonas sp. RC10]|nr:hypothetical protein [Luteimonas sp. RC10]